MNRKQFNILFWISVALFFCTPFEWLLIASFVPEDTVILRNALGIIVIALMFTWIPVAFIGEDMVLNNDYFKHVIPTSNTNKSWRGRHCMICGSELEFKQKYSGYFDNTGQRKINEYLVCPKYKYRHDGLFSNIHDRYQITEDGKFISLRPGGWD